MKIARFEHQQNLYVGLIENGSVRPIVFTGLKIEGAAVDPACRPSNGSMRWVIENREQFDTQNRDWLGDPISIDQVRLMAPIASPEKIVCVGRNYADHAAEMGSEVRDLPVIFNKFPSAIAGPGDAITIPAISEAVDYEAELVVVMGRKGRDIARKDALDYVFGYCCGNDVSARDWQKGRPGGQWLLGKTFDGFAPIGPWITTKDQVNVDDLDIELTLNGLQRQHSNTSLLMFKIDYLVSHLSRFVTWQPGDLLFTGTPAGVGAGHNPPRFLSDGDETTVTISGLGQLTNRFVASDMTSDTPMA